MNSQAVLNIAAYKFVKLDDLEAMREELRSHCNALGLRGTILLSPEGINLFLAGPPEGVRTFLAELRGRAAFSDLEVKESYCDKIPFRRMLVRLKKEIIAFGVESVVPEERTSPKLAAKELREWLDSGRKVRLLDVRNTYEVELGTFEHAEDLKIGHFREFPDAIAELPEEAKKEPLVMFCTGGIRCEKAGPLMEQAGFEQVYQLDGGILKYFEECGGAHYDGSCFVFDGRVSLDPELKPTGNLLCFACQAVLSPEDITSEKFMFGQYCPNCYLSPNEQHAKEFERMQASMLEIASSQPGCTPYMHVRDIHVAGRFRGLPLLEFLCKYHPPTPREDWQRWIANGEILRDGTPVHENDIVKEGERFQQHTPDVTEPPIAPEIKLLHADELLIVVDKPAPMPVHPSGRFNRNSLTWIVGKAFAREKLSVAHRLDANTTGVVVLCRKHQASRYVQPQFANQTVEKRYIARVHGHPTEDRFECDLSISNVPQPGGGRYSSRSIPTTQNRPRTEDQAGLDVAKTEVKSEPKPLLDEAFTSFEVLERFPDGSSLIAAFPKTGRTHQIRLHLWELGFPVVGDPLYLRDSKMGTTHTLRPEDPPMCLHAQKITLRHPQSERSVTYETELPSWAAGDL